VSGEFERATVGFGLADGCKSGGGSWVARGREPIFCNPRIEAGVA